MSVWLRIPLQFLALASLGFVAVLAVVFGSYFYVEPGLPEAEELREAAAAGQIPLRVLAADGSMMRQYGESREPADLDDIPERLRQAVIAAEDDRFYKHAGIDPISTARAVLNYGIKLATGSDERIPGGSTITQQVTRTTELLSYSDRGLSRKIPEIFLAFRIESEFTKDEILELYLNTYFFGQSSYGVVAAAQTYFNKRPADLTLSEIAIIAGIPTAPSTNNPYNGPENAARRRAYVLRRMHELGHITSAEREAALAEPIVAQKFAPAQQLEAEYVTDWAYTWCQQRMGKAACDRSGLTIETTISSREQRAMNNSLRNTLENYDRNHGYRGPLGRIDFALLESVDNSEAGGAGFSDMLTTLLADYEVDNGAVPAVVLGVNGSYGNVWLQGQGVVSIGFDAVSWARSYISDTRQGPAPETVNDVLAVGDIVRFRRRDDGSFVLAQIPGLDDIQGAMVATDPQTGAIVALAGGYSFWQSQFNRVTQAVRQPGSSFKPFFYLAALDNGYTLSSVINDAADCFYDAVLEDEHCVENYERRYFGPTRLREVLINSLNASAHRVIQDIGAGTVARYVERFGIETEPGERNASLALGGLGLTPIELANAYTILANGGYAVGIADPQTGTPRPYLVDRVINADGEVLYDAARSVRRVCPEPDPLVVDDAGPELVTDISQLYPTERCAERVESEQRIFLITDVMKDVIRSGSGARAGRAFTRQDLAGKTGTTSETRDAWFAGFNGDRAAVAWVGFDDDSRSLGRTASYSEQGGVTAIPAWIDYMQVALEGKAENSLAWPSGVVQRKINPDTGEIAADCNFNVIDEFFLVENQPRQESSADCVTQLPQSLGEDTPRSGDSFFE